MTSRGVGALLPMTAPATSATLPCAGASTDGYTGTYAYGNKTGLGETIQCQGTFAGPPAYGVVSQDMLVK